MTTCCLRTWHGAAATTRPCGRCPCSGCAPMPAVHEQLCTRFRVSTIQACSKLCTAVGLSCRQLMRSRLCCHPRLLSCVAASAARWMPAHWCQVRLAGPGLWVGVLVPCLCCTLFEWRLKVWSLVGHEPFCQGQHCSWCWCNEVAGAPCMWAWECLLQHSLNYVKSCPRHCCVIGCCQLTGCLCVCAAVAVLCR